LTIAAPNLPSGGDIAYAANSNNALQHHATNGPYAVLNTNFAIFFIAAFLSLRPLRSFRLKLKRSDPDSREQAAQSPMRIRL
jgi:hypothetical protein